MQALNYLYNEHKSFLMKILPSIKVYARVAPKQKVFNMITLLFIYTHTYIYTQLLGY